VKFKNVEIADMEKAEKILLVVDDSRLSRMMIGAAVKEYNNGWAVLEASTADEAVIQCEKHNITAITLDMNMPGRNGLEVAPKLKELIPNVYIALLTANVQNSIKVEAANLGLTFISKPVTEEKVIGFLKTVENSF
jgi:two-component system chemotaxis response regulator CheY